ncbi:Imm30 family immunity protein [Geobacillus icigianus]|uniref:Imm30 family immunity protein n=1 Tax=Geobacillus TaxID=129337 RepID=UPI00053B6CA9|nr:Imm30 family immunity protein [Geobacillus sp. B4113_201601]
MDIKSEIKKVYHNRLLETEKQVEEFEQALKNIYEYDEVSIIKDLMLAFDDNTENHEVMFNLVHTIEHLYKNKIEEGLKLIANSVPIIIDYGREWIEILHYRILNHPQVRMIYAKVLRDIDIKARNIIKDLLEDIKREDPELFSDSVDEVLGSI